MDILLILFVLLIIALSIGVILYQALRKNPKPLEQTVIELSCENTEIPRQISPLPSFPFQIIPSTEGWGSVYIIFYGKKDYTNEIGSQLVMLDGVNPMTVYPVNGTKSIGYIFRCNPITKTVVAGQDVILNPNLPYWFTSNGVVLQNFTLYDKDGDSLTIGGAISATPSKPQLLDLVRYTAT